MNHLQGNRSFRPRWIEAGTFRSILFVSWFSLSTGFKISAITRNQHYSLTLFRNICPKYASLSPLWRRRELSSITNLFHVQAASSWSTNSENNDDIGGFSTLVDEESVYSSSDDEETVDTIEIEDEKLETESIGDQVLEDFHLWSRALDQALSKLDKKRNSLELELDKARGLESTTARAQLLVSNLYQFNNPGVKRATVQDWENGGIELELTLDPQYDSASAEADALFAQARKLKRGSKIINGLLEETSNAVEMLQKAKVDLDSALLPDGSSINEGRLRLVQEYLERTSAATNFQIPTPPPARVSGSKTSRSGAADSSRRAKPELGTPASNVRKLKSPGGCIVWVGRNQRGNEYISFQIAKGNDIWMHARGCPGAHVVLQSRRGDPKPTEECLQFAANLAIFYSDARTERKAPVTVAEPKHILKPPGSPLGTVKLREESQVVAGRPDDVPNELKEAREGSGLTDEYRTTDKAKHKRKTQEAVKQNREKQRVQAKSKRKDRNRHDTDMMD